MVDDGTSIFQEDGQVDAGRYHSVSDGKQQIM